MAAQDTNAPAPPTNARPEPKFLSRLTNEFDRELAIRLISRLDPETQRKLGYDPRLLVDTNRLEAFRRMAEHLTNYAARGAAARPPAPPAKPGLVVWLEQMEKQRQQAEARTRIYEQRFPKTMKVIGVGRWVIGWGSILAVLALYLYICHCCRELCWRTGTPSHILIWLPLFKRLALFRATGVSKLWFWVGFIVPFVGLAGWVLCCWRVCETFQKSKWLTLAMACPLVGWIAFMWLAAATRAEDENIAVKRLRAGYAF